MAANAAAFAASAAAPQSTPQDLARPPTAAEPSAVEAESDPVQLEDVVVTGMREAQIVRNYVETVAEPPANARLSRWRGPVCVTVAGMREGYGQMTADAITARAAALGLRAGEPGCDTNVFIFVTDDATNMSKAMVKRWPRTFEPRHPLFGPDRSALDRFVNSQAPVRWWHLSAEFHIDTDAISEHSQLSRTSQRVQSAFRYDLIQVVVIVDLTKATGVPVEGLIDYLSMVALAQIDPEADFADAPTVLNLFNRDIGIDALTAWDASYLSGLYGSRVDLGTSSQQTREVMSAMLRARLTETE